MPGRLEKRRLSDACDRSDRNTTKTTEAAVSCWTYRRAPIQSHVPNWLARNAATILESNCTAAIPRGRCVHRLKLDWATLGEYFNRLERQRTAVQDTELRSKNNFSRKCESKTKVINGKGAGIQKVSQSSLSDPTRPDSSLECGR
jgi:hypothetical protein